MQYFDGFVDCESWIGRDCVFDQFPVLVDEIVHKVIVHLEILEPQPRSGE